MNKTSVFDLQECLKKGVVKFSYTKKDGSVREAIGTRCMKFVDEEFHPNPDAEHTEYTNIRYFDFNSNGWRSFLPDKFVEIIEYPYKIEIS